MSDPVDPNLPPPHLPCGDDATLIWLETPETGCPTASDWQFAEAEQPVRTPGRSWTTMPAASSVPWRITTLAAVIGITVGVCGTLLFIRGGGHESAVGNSRPATFGELSRGLQGGVGDAATTPPIEKEATPNEGMVDRRVCGVDLGAPAVIDAVKQLPPFSDTGWEWSVDPSGFKGNYTPCSALSTVLVMPQSATGSSPVIALMFHDGGYVGTATTPHGFTTVNVSRTTDDTVVLDYKLPGECNACPPAGIVSVRYQWQGDHIEMLDPPPPY